MLQFRKFSIWFFDIFQNYPLNQHYRDHQFCHFSTAKISSWYMAFIRKMVFQRKSNASTINLWNKILGQLKLRVFTTENIYKIILLFFILSRSLLTTFPNLRSSILIPINTLNIQAFWLTKIFLGKYTLTIWLLN